MKKNYYFDYNATTPLLPEVREAILPYLSETYGNPSSIHKMGQDALHALTTAREQIAALIHADPHGIFFTSGATESNNAAIQSALLSQPEKKRIVTSAVEHSSVRNVVKEYAARSGREVVWISSDQNGSLNLTELKNALTEDVALLSIMWANNETGIIYPVEEIAALAKAKGILMHVDAVQAIGKLPMDLSKLPIDFLSLSAHKFYGPKGTGILYVKNPPQFKALMIGGTQEWGKRGGTENVPGIVGMGKAAEYIQKHMAQNIPRMETAKKYLENTLLSKIPGIFVNGAKNPRVCNTISLTIPNVSAEVLIPRLDEEGICVSSGSACLTGALEPSKVLLAMGFSEKMALSTIRLSIGSPTTDEEINYVCDVLPKVVAEIKKQIENIS